MMRREPGDTKEAVQRELRSRFDEGAGLAELIDELHKRSGRRFGRRWGLSDADLEELSLYCWTLQQDQQPALWGRAREMWGGSRLRTARLGSGSKRRSAHSD